MVWREDLKKEAEEKGEVYIEVPPNDVSSQHLLALRVVGFFLPFFLNLKIFFLNFLFYLLLFFFLLVNRCFCISYSGPVTTPTSAKTRRPLETSATPKASIYRQ
jgi:hypothetical protein